MLDNWTDYYTTFPVHPVCNIWWYFTVDLINSIYISRSSLQYTIISTCSTWPWHKKKNYYWKEKRHKRIRKKYKRLSSHLIFNRMNEIFIYFLQKVIAYTAHSFVLYRYYMLMWAYVSFHRNSRYTSEYEHSVE